MGCDIHLRIEYKRPDSKYWMDLGGEFSERIYGIFAKLAGVRNYYDITPISDPRGFPKDASDRTLDAYSLWVTDKYDAECTCSKEDAERWIEQGCSQRIDGNRISNPDWHTASRVTAKEMEQAVKEIFCPKGEWEGDYIVFRCISVLMNELVACGQECRAVFWFDN